MNDKTTLDPFYPQFPGIIQQFPPIGVGTEAVDSLYPGIQVVLFAKDLDHGPVLYQPPTQRVGSLPADN